ncbi:CBO0543 family protein [Sutcliffiella deserti]|uniref:CBO0543 family protein n=1 Tax=Sutcliffiella deserti TaxID=2875501 RepID=UPI001CBFDF28|nr:CBO0543 family protein [Sutcliffiella deserti]
MTKEQMEILNRLKSKHEQVTYEWIDYWWQYSSFNTWQFWVNVLMLVVPLVILWFKLDRSKAFHLGFYGFTVHIIFTYFDSGLIRFGLISYPYQAIPFIPVNFGLDVSLIPVLFMLVYQWTLNQRKNYYLSFLLLTAFLAFVFKPILYSFDLILWHKWANPFYLFLFYIVIFTLSKWLTNLFLHFERNSKREKVDS